MELKELSNVDISELYLKTEKLIQAIYNIKTEGKMHVYMTPNLKDLYFQEKKRMEDNNVSMSTIEEFITVQLLILKVIADRFINKDILKNINERQEYVLKQRNKNIN